MNNKEAYLYLRHALGSFGLPEADAEARETVCHFAGCRPGDIIGCFDKPARFDPAVIAEERRSGRPLAYILGEKGFYGLSFYVDERVLIPRYDTEIIVDEALKSIGETDAKSVLDMCCGSGCIGIVLAKNSECNVSMCDISEGALEVSRINMIRNGAEDIKLIKSDLFNDVPDAFDMIVSNPPYVTEDEYETLEVQVKDFEPSLALLGGLDYYKRIAKDAGKHLNPGGRLLLEIGYGQRDDVITMLSENGFEEIHCAYDLVQIPRVIICTKN